MNENDDGTIQVLLERFNKQRLPRAISLKEKVDSGQRLNDYDIQFLEQVFRDFSSVQHLVESHPEYKPLVARVIQLYHDITERAVENEQASSSG